MGGGPLTSVFESSHSGNEIRCWLVIVVVHSLFPFFSFCSFITPLAYSQAVSYRDFRRSKITAFDFPRPFIPIIPILLFHLASMKRVLRLENRIGLAPAQSDGKSATRSHRSPIVKTSVTIYYFIWNCFCSIFNDFNDWGWEALAN